ncbi:MAG: glycosyltransferase family 2 protein [Verrucomicrobiae bacterium]|nr:glycosyltransferase family 2 protein [Verrucomicrobiae bacterium]
MIGGKRVVVVLPAYQAARTLERTVSEICRELVDDILLVDDASSDETVAIAHRLNLRTFVHEHNTGYGGNQKTCYHEAMKLGADIVVMVHPDYQYSPRLLGAMIHMLVSGHYDIVLGSRILGQCALEGGMPLYKYAANRCLTLLQNILLRQKLSEYHTGYRAYSRHVLEKLPFDRYSDDFLFDNQILCEAINAGFRIGEISCPTRYFPEASSINLHRSLIYGLGVLGCAIRYNRWFSMAAGK